VLNQTLVDTLATIEFGHMGIYMLDPVGAQPSADEIRRVKAEMYCEEIAFTRSKISPPLSRAMRAGPPGGTPGPP
jgi:hypothetical protein